MAIYQRLPSLRLILGPGTPDGMRSGRSLLSPDHPIARQSCRLSCIRKPAVPLFARLLIGALILFFASGASADDAPGGIAPAPSIPRLDQKAVHDEYINGNFESVLKRIEIFRKKNPDFSRDDSVFIARHLAVVLAADPRSVEAGKYWMHRLLLLSPDADLSGMYASEAIERMFREVKAEDDARTGRIGRRKWLWIGAGGTAVAAGVAVWVLFSHASDGPQKTVVPVNL